MKKLLISAAVTGAIATCMAPVRAAGLGGYFFNIDPVPSTFLGPTPELGGLLYVDLIGTLGVPGTPDGASLITSLSPNSYFIENILSLDKTSVSSGTLRELLTLLPTGVKYGNPLDPLAPTEFSDNLWLNATPVVNFQTHLTGGGFAFYYGNSPTDPNDRYQVFFKSTVGPTGEYLGCWGNGSCTRTQIQTPAPLPLLGVGAGFAYSRKLRRRISAS
jgi:hypothetical protein